MLHRDRPSPLVINHQTLKQVVDWLLVPALFADMKGRCTATWKPRMLAVAALLWATSELNTLHARVEQARKIVKKVFRWQPAPGTSYPGFVKMLGQWQPALLAAIVPHLREQMQEVGAAQWETAGYVVFAGDGSRVELARSEALEVAFAPPRPRSKSRTRRKPGGKRGGKRPAARRSAKKQSAAARRKKATSPQMWLTLLWHVGSGLPWAWRTGPSGSSERGHLEAMLPTLPANALITADAGFMGYDFWHALLEAGHHFVIRVGANVRLVRSLGWARESEQTVYLWPNQMAKQHQPPVVLRLGRVHDGKQPVYLVTDLPKGRLSDRHVLQIYGARWGIEVFFHTFKQTFGCRKLRSRAAETAQLELDWALLGLWSVGLLGQRELAASGQDPTRLSPAAAIRAFQGTLRDYRVRPDSSAETLWAHLRRAVRDDYPRRSSKTSRSYPRKKQRAPIGVPTITRATPSQITQATELKQHPELRTAWPSGQVTAWEAPKLRPVPGGLTGPALLGQPEDPELPQAA